VFWILATETALLRLFLQLSGLSEIVVLLSHCDAAQSAIATLVLVLAAVVETALFAFNLFATGLPPALKASEEGVESFILFAFYFYHVGRSFLFEDLRNLHGCRRHVNPKTQLFLDFMNRFFHIDDFL